jgi:hypothetical protein
VLLGDVLDAFSEFKHSRDHAHVSDTSQADFGLILPRLSLLATIGFAYSVLNPIINVFALLSSSFALF